MFGASIIYVEYIVRLFPSWKQFRIQDSNVFLACSFSMSFGVMVRLSLAFREYKRPSVLITTDILGPV
jgi:ZIP family zinc transporter